MDARVMSAIIGMALLTYLPRLLPMLILAGRALPKPAMQWLQLLPPAILGALVAQAVFTPEGYPNISMTNPFILPAVATVLVAWRTRNLGWTVIAGLVAAGLYNGLI